MKITKKQRQLFLACAIGDGHIDKNGSLTIFHCEKQKSLVEHKLKLLYPFLSKKELISRNSNNTLQFGIRCKVNEFTKKVRRFLYPNGKKTITRKILNNLTVEGIALWWMDDGHCGIKKENGKIKATVSTLSTCVDKETNQVIIDWFLEKYNIRFGQRKMKNNYALICGTKEGRKLRSLIEPFVIEEFKYKLSQ